MPQITTESLLCDTSIYFHLFDFLFIWSFTFVWVCIFSPRLPVLFC